MNVSVYQSTVPQFITGLKALKGFLRKGQAYCETKKIDMSVLLQTRLAPDQFPLSKQIHITCDTAKFCAARLTGVEAPAFDDKEQTLEEFNARIDKTIAFLEKFRPEQFADWENKVVRFHYRPGYSLDGKTYLSAHAIPNFYFHLTTAYSILRASGVDLGKNDFLYELPWKQD